VSKGSHAENIGIERGDIIESFNGRCVSTTVEVGVLEISRFQMK
jgi:S1-C subfamily serine protease